MCWSCLTKTKHGLWLKQSFFLTVLKVAKLKAKALTNWLCDGVVFLACGAHVIVSSVKMTKGEDIVISPYKDTTVGSASAFMSSFTIIIWNAFLFGAKFQPYAVLGGVV